MKKVLLKIDGMTCSACSSGLEKYLNKQAGIKSVAVNLVMNDANIEYDESKISVEQIEKFISKAGFTSLGIDNFEKESKKISNEKYKLLVLLVISLLILYISMAHMINLPSVPVLDIKEHPLNYAISLFILSTIVLFMGKDILKNGYKNLFNKTPTMDTLVAIGVFASYIYSIYGTYKIINGESDFVHNLYYESSAIVIFFIKIGKYIENINKDKTKEAIKNLMSITPNHATIIRENQELPVTLDEIKKCDVVLCRPGEKIAVDGKVIEGVTHIDESFITGESIPNKKEIGSKVLAGSINYDGTIKYKAERIGKDSTVSEIVKIVTSMTATKAPIAKIADKISGYFVPIVLFIAFLAFIVWYVLTKDFAHAINIFVSVLVVACPCSLGLATPLAIVVASGNASKRGILIKSSETLENAHKVKTICFDKTGTLTIGKLTVYKVYNYSDIPENELIKEIASIENKSEHPIAKAIVEYANCKNLKLEEIKDFESIFGFGIYAKNLNGDEYYIGNKKLMDIHEIQIKNNKDESELSNFGCSILFVAKNGKLISLIGVKDKIKENVKDVVKKLKDDKINVVMLTGDNEKTALSVAKQIGIESIIANVTPKEKASKIKELKRNGLVMMCGDGINDSISLIAADIGVSMSSGTDIAMDSAQVILMNNDLEKLDELMEISRNTIKNIKQNLFWAFFYNVCMIPIACGVFSFWKIELNPMFAAFAMTLSSLTVVLNALRLKK